MDNASLSSTRTAPRDLAAEKAVLGAAFLSHGAIEEAMEFVSSNDFYQRAHQIVFAAMVKLNDQEKPIDVLTMQSELESEHQLDNIGGTEYLAELAGSVPTAANVGYYAKIVHDKATARRLIDVATEIVQKSYDGQENVNELLDEAETSILRVSESSNRAGFQRIDTVLNDSINHVYELSKNESDVTGLPTGYPQLDEMTTGLHDDELVIIAARPAMGKTAFALNIAQNVATSSDATVAIFSLEMGAESLVNRMLCAQGNINANHLRTGQLNQDEWNNFMVASSVLAQANIYIDDTPGISITELRSKCRKMKLEHGLSLVIIDYLQLMSGSKKGGNDNRQQEISEISRSLKAIARELHAPVIALSQLSRACETRTDHRPMLSDLRESGAIEQDADVVMFLYRDDYYNKDTEHPNEAEVIIAKQRNGPIGTVNLIWKPEYTKFVNAARPQGGNSEG